MPSDGYDMWDYQQASSYEPPEPPEPDEEDMHAYYDSQNIFYNIVLDLGQYDAPF